MIKHAFQAVFTEVGWVVMEQESGVYFIGSGDMEHGYTVWVTDSHVLMEPLSPGADETVTKTLAEEALLSAGLDRILVVSSGEDVPTGANAKAVCSMKREMEPWRTNRHSWTYSCEGLGVDFLIEEDVKNRKIHLTYENRKRFTITTREEACDLGTLFQKEEDGQLRVLEELKKWCAELMEEKEMDTPILFGEKHTFALRMSGGGYTLSCKSISPAASHGLKGIGSFSSSSDYTLHFMVIEPTLDGILKKAKKEIEQHVRKHSLRYELK